MGRVFTKLKMILSKMTKRSPVSTDEKLGDDTEGKLPENADEKSSGGADEKLGVDTEGKLSENADEKPSGITEKSPGNEDVKPHYKPTPQKKWRSAKMKSREWFSLSLSSVKLIFLRGLAVFRRAYVVISTEDFWRDVTSKCWDFAEAEGHDIAFLSDCGMGNIDESGSYIYRGENTVVVEYESGDDGYYVFFRTKDPEMVFPGDIKVGGSLDAVLKGKNKIPGKMKKRNAPNGLQNCQWEFEENVTFTIYAMEDVIIEFEYYNPTIQGSDKGYIDVKNLKYVTQEN